MSDLDGLMKRAADTPSTEPDIERAWSRGRTLRTRRRIGAGLAVAFIGVAGGVAVGAGGLDRDVVPRPAGDGSLEETSGPPAYVLSDFKIEYPYEPENPNAYEYEEGTQLAAVRYRARWANGSYPGTASCRLTLFDDSGNAMEELRFTLDSGSDVFHRPSGKVVGAVTVEPASADGVCSEGNFVSRDYEDVEATDVSPSYMPFPRDDEVYEDRLSVTFDPDWSGEIGFQRTCWITVIHKDGTETVGESFGTNMGNSPNTFNMFVGDPAEFETARLSCRDLEPDVTDD